MLEAELEAALHAPHDRLRVPRLVDLARVAAVRAPDEVWRFVDGATEREDVVSEWVKLLGRHILGWDD